MFPSLLVGENIDIDIDLLSLELRLVQSSIGSGFTKDVDGCVGRVCLRGMSVFVGVGSDGCTCSGRLGVKEVRLDCMAAAVGLSSERTLIAAMMNEKRGKD